MGSYIIDMSRKRKLNVNEAIAEILRFVEEESENLGDSHNNDLDQINGPAEEDAEELSEPEIQDEEVNNLLKRRTLLSNRLVNDI